MNGMEVIDIARDAIWTLLLISSPMMIVGLVVGVSIALLQALTQVQELTLVFVPKIISIFLTLFFTLSFMGDVLKGYVDGLMTRIIAG